MVRHPELERRLQSGFHPPVKFKRVNSRALGFKLVWVSPSRNINEQQSGDNNGGGRDSDLADHDDFFLWRCQH
jgi:hypothetical protein